MTIRRSTMLIIFSMSLVMAALIALGSWQVKRLSWKEELIARTMSRATSAPLSLSEIENKWQASKDVDYMAVNVKGEFKHDQEMYYYNTWNGQAGWNVITPLVLNDGRYVLLNRGFVPLALRNPNLREVGQIKGLVSIVGLARNPIKDKPNSLMPDNLLDKREFFWKNQLQMASLVANTSNSSDTNVLSFMIDAGKNNQFAKYPLGGTTRMNFPNNHLQYAVTWYGLALSLLVVGGVFLYGRRNQTT